VGLLWSSDLLLICCVNDFFFALVSDRPALRWKDGSAQLTVNRLTLLYARVRRLMCAEETLWLQRDAIMRRVAEHGEDELASALTAGLLRVARTEGGCEAVLRAIEERPRWRRQPKAV
jgi:hypothetical protein